MLKKMLVATIVLAASSSLVFGSVAPYVGGSIGLINNSTTSGTLSYRGLTGNLSLGYGGVMSQSFYFAGEVFGVPGTINLNGGNFNKNSWGVGLSIIPGFMITDKTMIYTRLGIIESHFTNGKTREGGGQLGLGLETNVCQNWDVRGEYVYTRYSNNINSDGVNFGLVYRFC